MGSGASIGSNSPIPGSNNNSGSSNSYGFNKSDIGNNKNHYNGQHSQQQGILHPIPFSQSSFVSLSANSIRTGTGGSSGGSSGRLLQNTTLSHSLLREPIGVKHWKTVLDTYKLSNVIQELESLGVVTNQDLLALPNNLWDEISRKLKFLESQRFAMMKQQYCSEHPSYVQTDSNTNSYNSFGETASIESASTSTEVMPMSENSHSSINNNNIDISAINSNVVLSSSVRSSPAPCSSVAFSFGVGNGTTNSSNSGGDGGLFSNSIDCYSYNRDNSSSLEWEEEGEEEEEEKEEGDEDPPPVYPESSASYEEIQRQIVLIREDLGRINETFREGFATGGTGSMYCRSMLGLSKSLLLARLERCRLRKTELEQQGSIIRAGSGKTPSIGSNSTVLSGTSVHGDRPWSIASPKLSPSPSPSPSFGTSGATGISSRFPPAPHSPLNSVVVSLSPLPIITSGSAQAQVQALAHKKRSQTQVSLHGRSAGSDNSNRRVSFEKTVKFRDTSSSATATSTTSSITCRNSRSSGGTVRSSSLSSSSVSTTSNISRKPYQQTKPPTGTRSVSISNSSSRLRA